jgi:hypothetical protein
MPWCVVLYLTAAASVESEKKLLLQLLPECWQRSKSVVSSVNSGMGQAQKNSPRWPIPPALRPRPASQHKNFNSSKRVGH